METGDGFVLWSIAKRGPAGPPLTDVEGEIRFSPEGRTVAAATKDGVRLWDAAGAEPVSPPLAPLAAVKARDLALGFSPDGKILAAVSSDDVILWDVAKRELTGILHRGGGGFGKFFWGSESQVVFSPDSRALAWLSNHGQYSRAGEIVLWDVAKRKPIVPPLSHRAAQRVEFGPDSKMMASGGNDDSLILWDVWSGRAIGEPLRGGKKRRGRSGVRGVMALAFSAKGETLVARTSEPYLLELWDVAHQPPQLVKRVDHPGTIHVVQGPGRSRQLPTGPLILPGSDIVLSPDNRVLAFRTDKHLALWDLANRDGRDQPVIVPGFEEKTIAFSRDGATLATYKDAKTGTVITLWDVATLMPPDRNR